MGGNLVRHILCIKRKHPNDSRPRAPVVDHAKATPLARPQRLTGAYALHHCQESGARFWVILDKAACSQLEVLILGEVIIDKATK